MAEPYLGAPAGLWVHRLQADVNSKARTVAYTLG